MASVTVTAGSITIQLVEASADLDLDQIVDIFIPMPAVYAEGEQFPFGSTILETPSPIIYVEGFSGIIGDVSIIALHPKILGEGFTLSAYANVNIKMPKVYAEGITSIIGDVDIIFPMPFRCIYSEGIALVLGDVEIIVPSPIVEVTAQLERLHEIWKSMIMNASNYSITEYNRWKFNSYANIDGDFYGADSDGIHLLTGNKINGEKIETSWFTGLFDFRNDFVKKIIQVLVVCRAEGELTLRIRLGEENFWENNLPVTIEALHEIRGKLAKGLKDRFFAFGITDKNGAPYTVKSIRAIVEVVRSRPR